MASACDCARSGDVEMWLGGIGGRGIASSSRAGGRGSRKRGRAAQTLGRGMRKQPIGLRKLNAETSVEHEYVTDDNQCVFKALHIHIPSLPDISTPTRNFLSHMTVLG